ncbi:MAG TPA: TolC family protein [Terriglobales bacterium]|jgi:outer membrane protein TolC|nr:TolC family protein [Terriglobales bacterium]
MPHFIRVTYFGLFLLLLAAAAAAQSTPAPAGAPAASSTSLPSLETAQNPFLGSVAEGKPTAEVIPLSLSDALDRGLRHNLGLLLAGHDTEGSQGARWRSLSEMLPKLTTETSLTREQINLATFGIPIPAGVSEVTPPFDVFDTRAFLRQSVGFESVNRYRAANQNLRAAQFTYQDARELVVLVVGNSYLQALASAARVQSAEAQFNTAERLYRQAVDLRHAGVVPGLDVLRAQVEMQARQQNLLSVRNDFEKQKLLLARVIGLPLGQPFDLSSKLPYEPLQELTLEHALEVAYQNRADYQAQLARVRAAELDKKAAQGEALPSFGLAGDYGLIGNNPGNAHSTFTIGAGIRIPIFQGGKVHGDTLRAYATLRRRQDELGDLRGSIELEVRNAFLDLRTAAERVEVAQQAVELARQQLQQSQDRFAAGVTDNVEVVQAQQAVAQADENYISSLNAHNVAKLVMAHALGVAERETRQYLEEKK